jgi:hypothetical protein
MPRQTRAEQKRAVKQRTQRRLAARKEGVQRGVETRRRNREARKQAHVALRAAEPQQGQAQAAEPKTKRPERTVAQDKRAGGAMVTVALRGEQAERLRALAAKHELTLAKLLVRMMEVFEAQAR